MVATPIVIRSIGEGGRRGKGARLILCGTLIYPPLEELMPMPICVRRDARCLVFPK